jgi:hypothetical protein
MVGIYLDVKVKVAAEYASQTQRMNGSRAPLIRNLGAVRGVWSAPTPPPRCLLERTRYPLYSRLGGPQGQCIREENRNPLGCTGF